MMEWFNILMARLRALFRRESVLRDIEEELRVHVEMETETNIERGMPPDEARATALKSFGNLARNTELGYDIRGGGWLEPVWQDLRYGARMLRKAPGFTAVAALALALGIGVNTSIFSIVNGFVLRPLPVEKPYELVAPFWGSKKDGEVWGQYSYANYIDLRDQNKTLSGLLASYMTSAGISGAPNDYRRAEVVWGELVSSNYFDVLGVKPVLGRGFLPEENRAQNTHPIVVLGHAFWWRRFNSDATIVGKTIFLYGSPFTVVGVAPAAFKGLDYGIRLDF